MKSGSIFTCNNHSLECLLFYSPDLFFFIFSEAFECNTFECNTTSDWLNHTVNQSEVVLHSNLQILGKKTKYVLENGW